MVAKRTHIIVRSVLIACTCLSLVATMIAQKSSDSKTGQDAVCAQTLQFKNELIDRVEPLVYTFRRIEFSGNVFIRDKLLRKHLSFDAGDIFKREHLEESIERLNRLKRIYPITFEDVALRADDRTKDVDLIFCFEERPR